MMIYRSELDDLIERAKQNDPQADDLDLGKKFFVELLHFYIGQYRVNKLTAEQFKVKKKQLERDLINYWDFQDIFRCHTEIRNKQSRYFIEAEKYGCPICKKLVRIFDGREANES
ncbi:MAG: hypothetical protein K2M82_01060 [Lachnospiraceae bacterium]|nr:hypothetical protein [Lachnospiraceae bacterium]